jgi:hypothetical protein
VYDFDDGVRHYRIIAMDDADFARQLKALLDKEEEDAVLLSWLAEQKSKWAQMQEPKEEPVKQTVDETEA